MVQIHSSESARESLAATAVRDVCAHHKGPLSIFHYFPIRAVPKIANMPPIPRFLS